MRLMEKIRNDARERDARDARQRAAQEEAAQGRSPLSTADLAATDTQPLDARTADATRDDLAHARAAREDVAARAARESVRGTDEPAGKLRDADVEDAVEVARRDDTHAAPDVKPRADARAHDTRVHDARVADTPRAAAMSRDEPLAPLFHADVAQGFRARWDATQIGFVDDPRQAVQQADELVAQVMKSLAQSFADERRQLEAQMKETASTENLRVALQRYRSFFQRLLSL
ncbi:MAG TPA: hypothetical protein VFO28_08075 [Burkholderiaceae bacterium]|nr:hypothetical protein [Burkholderiaceae bacterium]